MERTKVLQTENVGENGTDLYVLRVVENETREVFEVQVVDFRGKVVFSTPFKSESNARIYANSLYKRCRAANGWEFGV